MFELICGYLPFGDQCGDPTEVYRSIQKDPLVFPEWLEEEFNDARDLISSLLNKLPESRLSGSGLSGSGMNGVMAHKFFNGLDWNSLFQKKIPPSYTPDILDESKDSIPNLIEEVTEQTNEFLKEANQGMNSSYMKKDHKKNLQENIQELDLFF